MMTEVVKGNIRFVVIIVFAIIVFFGTLAFIGNTPGSKISTQDSQKEEILQSPTPTPNPSSPTAPVSWLNEKIGKIRLADVAGVKKATIQGYVITVGDTWDSVVNKLGKTALKTTTDENRLVGMIVEHRYKEYSILVAREPANLNYFIVWDIYPNEDE